MPQNNDKMTNWLNANMGGRLKDMFKPDPADVNAASATDGVEDVTTSAPQMSPGEILRRTLADDLKKDDDKNKK